MICSVSESPVMNMIGTCASARFCFSLRQVAKPSAPGMTASMRITSGTSFSTIDRACSPSRATRTVMPASSSASVINRSVSGDSSTTSTMSLVSPLRMSGTDLLQRGCVSLEVESVHDRAHQDGEFAAFRRVVLDLAQLLEYPRDMPDFAEPDQLVDIDS